MNNASTPPVEYLPTRKPVMVYKEAQYFQEMRPLASSPKPKPIVCHLERMVCTVYSLLFPAIIGSLFTSIFFRGAAETNEFYFALVVATQLARYFIFFAMLMLGLTLILRDLMWLKVPWDRNLTTSLIKNRSDLMCVLKGTPEAMTTYLSSRSPLLFTLAWCLILSMI
jgi:hypothetical protein